MGCECRRRISRMAWRGPVTLRDFLRSCSASFGNSARGWQCPCFTPAILPSAELNCKSFAIPTAKKPRIEVAGRRSLHEQNLTRALNGAIQPPLVMRRQAGIFAGQNPALVGHELLEQIGVLEIQRIRREINLGLGPGRANFIGTGPAAGTALISVGMRLAWHKLL